MVAMDNFLLSKEKSQAAFKGSEAKPALSGRSEGEGACPTHYYWSSHGRETNSFGKGGHERGNRENAETARRAYRLCAWLANGVNSTHTDTPESSAMESGFGVSDRKAARRGCPIGSVNTRSASVMRASVFTSSTNCASPCGNRPIEISEEEAFKLSFFFNRALVLDIYTTFVSSGGAMEGPESVTGKGCRANVFSSAANSGSAAKNESKSQFGRLRRLGSLMRFFSFISRPRLWLWFGAGNVAVQGFQGEVVAGHNVINFTTLYLAYGGLRYAGFGRNLSLGHPGSPNCCQKITCLHQLYSFATILK